jgi:hypothetical protein
MRIGRTVYAMFVVLAILLSVGSLRAQQKGPYPAFTMVMQTIEYDAKGRAVGESNWTRYQSANGAWREASTYDGEERAMLYRGQGSGYKSTSRTSVLIKAGDHVHNCPLTTPAQLRADPHFVRTEVILGFTAYVHKWSIKDDQIEEAFVPEIGSLSIRGSTTYPDGSRTNIEPMTVILGEPAKEDIAGPDYPVIEQRPINNEELAKLILTKPAPVYPPQAIVRRISGTASVQVTVDTNGRVIFATATSVIPYINFAAEEAAYSATFSPTVVDGKPAVVIGSIDYEFVLPQQGAATKEVSDAQKQEFIRLLKTLPKCGEFYCDEAIEKVRPYLPVLFALSEKDLEKLDIYPFLAISQGLLALPEHREYGVLHFADIRHPRLMLFWAASLYELGSGTPEVVRVLRDALGLKEQAKILSEILGPKFEDLKKRVLPDHAKVKP